MKKTASALAFVCLLGLAILYIPCVNADGEKGDEKRLAGPPPILFEMDFYGSTNLADFISDTPTRKQFNGIGATGTTTIAMQNGGLVMNRPSGATGAASFSRTTDLSPTPSSLMAVIVFDVATTNANINNTGMFQFGGNFTTNHTNEPSGSVHSRFGLNLTATANEFSFRDISRGVNTQIFNGLAIVAVYVNNSGAEMTYTGMGGSTETIANDTMDLWANGMKVIDDSPATNPNAALTDFKFALANGFGRITTAGLYMSEIPPMNGPPPAPVITGSTPSSPGTSRSLALRGTSADGTTILIFKSANCDGSSMIGTGWISFPREGVNVTANALTTTAFTARALYIDQVLGPCSEPYFYTHIANSNPTAVADTFYLAVGSPSYDLDVLANDSSFPDQEENIVVNGVSQPVGASITNNSSHVTLVPNDPNTPQTFAFIYNISDGNGGIGVADSVAHLVAPSPASISGNATGANGLGIARAFVTISGGNLKEPVTAVTNTFGRFRFNGLLTGYTYNVTIAAKRYTFTPSSRSVNVGGDVSDLMFVGN